MLRMSPCSARKISTTAILMIPLKFRLDFVDLSAAAKEALADYVRQDVLIATATATYDESRKQAPVKQIGERLVFPQFSPWFKAYNDKVLVEPLRLLFSEVTTGLADFPAIGRAPSKPAMLQALRKYEEERPELCTPERSDDQFYGVTRGKGRLEPFIQWIYVPAVKDASEEGVETANTALGKLLQRTVRQKVNFTSELEAISAKARQEYDVLLSSQQKALEELSGSLSKKFETFAHPGAGIAVEWLQGSDSSIKVDPPKAAIKATEGPFKGSLVRFGHGLQRSFLLVILQELAELERESGENEKPTLVLGIEEPELYQHPPQARHLSNELRALTDAGNQVFITTHSPYFVSGESFDEVRYVRKKREDGCAYLTSTTFEKYAIRIATASGTKPDKPATARARLLAALRPEPSELYFCHRLILVEGVEDRAYLTCALHVGKKLDGVRRAGVHTISCDRKSNILQLLCIAQELEIPTFVVFDADGDDENAERKGQHRRDNECLIKAMSIKSDPFPAEALINGTCAIWPNNLEKAIKASYAPQDWTNLQNAARNVIDPQASLKKNPAYIAELTHLMWNHPTKPAALIDLVSAIEAFSSV
jgi:putative ATP-dependent endonuclease of the OLD family